MICEHYGLKYERHHLQSLCLHDRQGVSIASVSAAAQQIGFRCRIVEARTKDLVEHGLLPAIAFWPKKHFVVVYNVRGNVVSVADPAFGTVAYTIDDFSSRWEFRKALEGSRGVVLLLEPIQTIPSIQRRARARAASGRTLMAPYLADFHYLVWPLLVCASVTLGAYVALPWLARSLVDLGIRRNDIYVARLFIAGQFVAIVAQAVAQSIQAWLFAGAGNRINGRLTSDFLAKLARLPLSFFDRHVQSDLVQRVSDHYLLQEFLASVPGQAVLMVLLIVVFGLALGISRPRFLVMYMAGGSAYLLAIAALIRRRRRLDYERFAISSQSHGVLLEYLNGIQDLRLYGAEKAGQRKWQAVQERLALLNNRLAKGDQITRLVGVILSSMTTLIITGSAAEDVASGVASLGWFFAVQFIIGQLNAPLAQLTDILRRWQDTSVTLDRIANIHLHPDEWAGDAGVLPAGGDINVRKVSFSYGRSSTRSVLTDVSLRLPKGKTTAIVGASGSGKTTLLKLLLGVYLPDSGAITIGDCGLGTIAPSLWRDRCGVVMQDGFLFSDTIGGNVALGHEHWDPGRLEYVLRLAQLQDLVASLPRGVETEVGRDGIGLSHGQTLRILIARALYNDPEYLFLDEATSALDAETESAVIAGIRNATHGKTVMMIAHRLSTVRDADQIIVLDRGRVIETGSHADLVSRRGKYYDLVKNQLDLNKR